MFEPVRASRSDWQLIGARTETGNAAPVTGLSLFWWFQQGNCRGKWNPPRKTCFRVRLRGIPLIICSRVELWGIPLVTCTSAELRKYQFFDYFFLLDYFSLLYYTYVVRRTVTAHIFSVNFSCYPLDVLVFLLYSTWKISPSISRHNFCFFALFRIIEIS